MGLYSEKDRHFNLIVSQVNFKRRAEVEELDGFINSLNFLDHLQELADACTFLIANDFQEFLLQTILILACLLIEKALYSLIKMLR